MENTLNTLNNNFEEIKVENSLKRHYYGTISSLHILNNKYLLSGNGNILCVYSIDEGERKLIFSKQIFENNKITKIKSFDLGKLNYENSETQNNGKNICIFFIGETEISYCIINENSYIESSNCLNFEKMIFQLLDNKIVNQSRDYIVELNLIKSLKENKSLGSNEKYFNLLIGYTGNYLEIYKCSLQLNKSEITSLQINFEFSTRIFCPEKCIIYSMHSIVTENRNEIIISSGTVFRNIIIWKISQSSTDTFSPVPSSLILKGHQGVIFNLQFISENSLLSVSDDRTTRLWEVDFNKNYIPVVDVFIGHSARVWDAKIFNFKNNKFLVSSSEDSTLRIYCLKTKKFIKELSGGHVGKNIRVLEIWEDGKFIFSAGEDAQIIQWNLEKIITEVEGVEKKGTQQELEKFSYSLSTSDDQFILAKLKQKNFTPSVKALKLISDDQALIATNHGQVLLYNLETNNIEKIIFSDEQCRVINSIEYINELGEIIIGVSDGQVIIKNLKNLEHSPLENSIKIFSNIRIPYISYKILENSLFIIFCNPLGLVKIFYLKNLLNNFKRESFYSILLELSRKHNYTVINTGIRTSSQICSFEIIKTQKNKLLLFLGDFDGNLYFTQLYSLDNQLILISELKFFKIHSDKISNIKYSINHGDDTFKNNKFLLHTSSHDGKLKKILVYNELNKFNNTENYTIKELDCKYRNDITSLEYFEFLQSTQENNNCNLISLGHYGRNLLIFDHSKNLIFHSNDVGGNNRPFDIKILSSNKIMYTYSESKFTYFVKVEIPKDNSDSLTMYTYNTPLHGRLIHCIKQLNLIDDISILSTGGEDTNINFYFLNKNLYIEKNNLQNFKFIEQFSRHSGAIRSIELVKSEKNSFLKNDTTEILIFSFILCSVAACSECFLFEFKIIFEKISGNKNNSNDFKIKKHSISFLHDLSVKQKNLDTRNMAIFTQKLLNEFYMISYCNTLAQTENFIFDLKSNTDPSSNCKSLARYSLKLQDTNFIPLSFVIVPAKYSEDEKNFHLIYVYGLTNGVLYLKKSKFSIKGDLLYNNFIFNENDNEQLSSDFSQYRIHEAGINEIKYQEHKNSKLIFTCGEDNSVNICNINENLQVEVIKKIKNLHSSPIKSLNIQILSTQESDQHSNCNLIYIITGGYDQKINILEYNSENYSTNVKKEIKTCLAELNGLSSNFISTNTVGKKIFISCVGQGLEIFNYNMK
jgi:WD40 repeat protein